MRGLLIDAAKESNQIIGRKRDFLTQLLNRDGRCIAPIQKSACQMGLFMVLHSSFLTSAYDPSALDTIQPSCINIY